MTTHYNENQKVVNSIGNTNHAVSTDLGQARITCPYQLANGLDTLKVSLWVEWEDNLFLDELEQAKKEIQTTKNDTQNPYHCPGDFDWNVKRVGTSKFNYILESGDLTLLLNRRLPEDNIPNIRFEIGSQSCWMPGYKLIYERFIRWINVLGGKVVKEIVSEVHLATDIIGLNINTLPIKDQNYWISQVVNFNVFNKSRKLSGITLGKGKTMLRVYDKVLELTYSAHKQETFSQVWGVQQYNEMPVTRVEFQVRREVLKDMREESNEQKGIDTVLDLNNALQSIWNYCTQKWARHCSTKIDHEQNHQSRAMNSEFWDIVTDVKWEGSDKFTKQKPRPNKNLKALCSQLRGIAMTITAFHQVKDDDIDHIVRVGKAILENELTDFYLNYESEFVKQMGKKKREIYESITPPSLKKESPELFTPSHDQPPF